MKIVYIVNEDGEYRVRVANDATIREDGAVVFEADGEQITREVGTYLSYHEWSKVANSIYKKAVRMAKERLQKNGTDR